MHDGTCFNAATCLLAQLLVIFAMVSNYPHCCYDHACDESLSGASSKLNKITACSFAFDCTSGSLQVPWQQKKACVRTIAKGSR